MILHNLPVPSPLCFSNLIIFCNLYRVAEGKAKKPKDFHDELGSEDEVETAPEKRLRLAKEYLARLEEEG